MEALNCVQCRQSCWKYSIRLGVRGSVGSCLLLSSINLLRRHIGGGGYNVLLEVLDFVGEFEVPLTNCNGTTAKDFGAKHRGAYTFHLWVLAFRLPLRRNHAHILDYNCKRIKSSIFLSAPAATGQIGANFKKQLKLSVTGGHRNPYYGYHENTCCPHALYIILNFPVKSFEYIKFVSTSCR